MQRGHPRAPWDVRGAEEEAEGKRRLPLSLPARQSLALLAGGAAPRSGIREKIKRSLLFCFTSWGAA